MNGTLPEWIWAIAPETLSRIKAAHAAGGTIEIGAALPVPQMGRSGTVAVIPIHGIMVRRTSILGQLFGETSTEAIASLVREAAADPNVRTALLWIDSPGGTTDSMVGLGDAVWQARQSGDLRVVAQVDGIGASAAYYVASQAEEIWANRMDMVGSIGVRGEVLDTSKMAEAEGIEVVSFDSGWFKSAGAPGLPVTDEQKAEFQRLVDVAYADFTKTVQRGRGMSASALKPLADGRLFYATEAVQNGLVDGIRTMADTMRKLSGGQRNRNRQRQALAT